MTFPGTKLILFLTLLLSCFIQMPAYAQVKDSASNMHLIYPTYEFSMPGADMARRFGFSHAIGAGYTYKRADGWCFTAEGNFIFRDGVKNPHSYMSGILTSDGFIIDESGVFANVTLLERGFTLWVKGGKLIPLKKPNANSGILLQFGAGMLQHKIRIEVQGNSVPQLSTAYKEGYDHLCNGPAISQFIGYQYFGNIRKINFFAGLEFVQSFTQSRRLYYFNDMQYANEKRIDLLSSIKIGWYIPIFSKTKQSYYYY